MEAAGLVRIDATVPIAGHDTVCGLLWEVGAVGIESIGELVRVTLPTDCVDAAGALLAGHGASPTAPEPVDPNAWKDLWREWAAAVRVEPDVVITPAWIEPPSRPGDVVIEVEPGDAWGHGAHPTTTLVVAALRAMGRLDGRRMLDVGCGSGVLSVAAARFGAADVVAVDIEPAAIVATADNAARNGVASQVVASLTPVESVAGTFDLVAANIGAGALIAMAPRLAALVRPGGSLLLSGLHADGDAVDRVEAAFAAWSPAERSRDGDWVALAFRAPSP